MRPLPVRLRPAGEIPDGSRLVLGIALPLPHNDRRIDLLDDSCTGSVPIESADIPCVIKSDSTLSATGGGSIARGTFLATLGDSHFLLCAVYVDTAAREGRQTAKAGCGDTKPARRHRVSRLCPFVDFNTSALGANRL